MVVTANLFAQKILRASLFQGKYLRPIIHCRRLNSIDTKAVADEIFEKVEKIKPSIVLLSSKKTLNFGLFKVNRGWVVGSGFIIHADGLVLTNAHIVHNAKNVSALTYNGRKCDAEVQLIDNSCDLAIVKIKDTTGLTVLNLADSRTAKIGQIVMAFGGPYKFPDSVSFGSIVSTKLKHETLPFGCIQTDAPTMNGNSGGPLVNLDGDVIGIIQLGFRFERIGEVSKGFLPLVNSSAAAVPSNIARAFLENSSYADLFKHT